LRLQRRQKGFLHQFFRLVFIAQPRNA